MNSTEGHRVGFGVPSDDGDEGPRASPHGLALALQPARERAGSVSAWFGTWQYGVGAVVVVLTGPARDALPALAVIVLAVTAMGLSISLIPVRNVAGDPGGSPISDH